jgi:opacity protein-like surface antigen
MSTVLSQLEDVMKLSSCGKARIALAAALMALSAGSAMADSDAVVTTNPESIGQGYGRAGGLVGSDRVMAIGKTGVGQQAIGIGYDKDVAERTNMKRGEAPDAVLGVTYDKDVAERTNMQRGAKPEPATKSVGVPGQSSN